jgi:hypothetical protein
MSPSAASYPRRLPAPVFRDRSVRRAAAKRKWSIVAILISATLLLPYTAAIYIGELKLTPIKILVVLLVLPAAFRLIGSSGGGQRRLLASDAYAFGTFVLMSLAPLIISGSRDLVSALSQAIEFYGMYLIARAYISDISSVEDLIRGLQVATIVVVALGLLDTVSHRYVTQDLTDFLFPVTPGRSLDASDSQLNRAILGMVSLRATSTFDHPILFGTFCATVLPLYLYSPMSRTRRYFLVAVCITGCLVALSSAPLLALSIVLSVHFYDRVMKAYKWRWKLLLSLLAACVIASNVVSDNPLGWLFRNLTFDPQTAYFRLLIWEAGATVVGNNPWLGIGFNQTGDRILDSSTDSLLLAKAIIYGVPMIALLYLSALSATAPIRDEAAVRQAHPQLDVTSTAFSLSLSTIMFVSITVTFWNAVWLFFALCIGARVSLKEQCLLARRKLEGARQAGRTSARVSSAR